jgi:hypothetical protein
VEGPCVVVVIRVRGRAVIDVSHVVLVPGWVTQAFEAYRLKSNVLSCNLYLHVGVIM